MYPAVNDSRLLLKLIRAFRRRCATKITFSTVSVSHHTTFLSFSVQRPRIQLNYEFHHAHATAWRLHRTIIIEINCKKIDKSITRTQTRQDIWARALGRLYCWDRVLGAANWPTRRNIRVVLSLAYSFHYIKTLPVNYYAYGARLLLAPAALGPLRLPPASYEFLDEARHPFAAA